MDVLTTLGPAQFGAETASRIGVSAVPLALLAYVALFFISAYAAFRIATTIDVPDVRNVDVIWATTLKSLAGAAATGLVARYLGGSLLLIIGVGGVIAPIVIYQRVFETTMRNAVVVWAGVTVVEVVIGGLLVLGAIGLGSWLDRKFDIPASVAAATVWELSAQPTDGVRNPPRNSRSWTRFPPTEGAPTWAFIS